MVSTKATRVPSILASLDIAGLPADAQRSLAQLINSWSNRFGVTLPEEKPMPTPTRVSAPKRAIEQEEPMLTNKQLKKMIKRAIAEQLMVIEPTASTPRPARTTAARTTTRRAPAKRKANTFIEHLADIHARNTEAGRVCKVKFTKGPKRGQAHGDFSADGWKFHREWCPGR